MIKEEKREEKSYGVTFVFKPYAESVMSNKKVNKILNL